MQISNHSNPQSAALSLQAQQQVQHHHQEEAGETVKETPAQENAEKGTSLLGTAGSLIDAYA